MSEFLPEANCRLAIALFGAWLDVNARKVGQGLTSGDLIGAWDEARNPFCSDFKYFTREFVGKEAARFGIGYP